MTNYNDGKWHGWNGGECPVHPKTEIQVSVAERSWRWWRGPAGDFCWSDEDTPIVAFLVVKEYKEPREWWVNIYPNGTPGYAWAKKESAELMKKFRSGMVVKVREVIE